MHVHGHQHWLSTISSPLMAAWESRAPGPGLLEDLGGSHEVAPRSKVLLKPASAVGGGGGPSGYSSLWSHAHSASRTSRGTAP